MDILEATRAYESWLGRHTSVVRKDLLLKHERMALSPFVFLRGTFYRWIQLWPDVCADLLDAPKVLSVGDLHVENFGTWRDAEGRLVWGVNDFDEAYQLAYTADLVRLAASACVAVEQQHLDVKANEACESILAGYQQWLTLGGRPFVLAEKTPWLRTLAENQIKVAAEFWDSLASSADPKEPIPPDALQILNEALLNGELSFRLKTRQAGMGSLGRPRYLALAFCKGGMIAREVKAVAPSAYVWAFPDSPPLQDPINTILARAIRCPDNMVQVRQNWMVRRLAPDCIKIEIGEMDEVKFQHRLLRAMGRETANIHLGSFNAATLSKDVSEQTRKKPNWLFHAAEQMIEELRKDRKMWKKERDS